MAPVVDLALRSVLGIWLSMIWRPQVCIGETFTDLTRGARSEPLFSSNWADPRGLIIAAILHRQIRSDIERKILSNEWQPGYRIPFEHELMIQYGCSRMTVSKALSSLAADGFLTRHRKRGTFVTYPDSHNASLRLPDLRAAVLESGRPYFYRLLSMVRRPISPDDTSLMQFARPGELLELETLHLADHRPFAWERRQINLSSVPEAASVDFTKVPPSVWLLTHVPWNNAEHQIGAMAADPDLAAKLEISPGSACLSLERRTWSGKGAITHALQIFPADQMQLKAKFLIGPSDGEARQHKTE
jgi:GntR family histidine utilization transcriptional repressor